MRSASWTFMAVNYTNLCFTGLEKHRGNIMPKHPAHLERHIFSLWGPALGGVVLLDRGGVRGAADSRAGEEVLSSSASLV